MKGGAFATRHPSLFHVTRRNALDGIRRSGLRPAAALCASIGTDNRADWTEVADGRGGTAWLRWQRMPDGPLAARLAPGITPAAWRHFVNGLVFFFESEAKARRLAAAPADRHVEQVVLQFETAALLDAGCSLLVCRWNNGYLDRSPPGRRRLRCFADYRPAQAWRPGEPLGEVAVQGPLPPSLPFILLAAPAP